MQPTKRQGIDGRLSRTACASLLAMAMTPIVEAQIRPIPARPGPPTAEQITRLEIRADREAVAAGEIFHIAVYLTSREGWHVYWRNPGEGAAPPEVNIAAPEGWQVGATRWPRPALKRTSVGETFIHEGRMALIVPVHAPISWDSDEATLRVRASWAVCDDNMCLFGEGSRTIRMLRSPDPTEATDADVRSRVAALPKRPDDPLNESSDRARIRQEGETLHMTVPAGTYDSAIFIPLTSPGVTYGAPQWRRDEDVLHLTVPLRIRPTNFLGEPPIVGGLIGLGDALTDPSYEFELRLHVPDA